VIFTVILIALATVCKFFFGPSLDWSGFSPVIAIALFSGFMIQQKNFSFLLPLVALIASDLLIHLLYINGRFDYAGFYAGQWKNYLILMSAVLIGWIFKGRNRPALLAGGLIAPTVFFLISNFNVWLASEVTYTKDVDGLMTCYAAGLPFYKNALLSTLAFLPLIAALYNYLTRHRTAITMA
jgi:hypothetical protein